jgi:anti-sigma factor RsiW
MICAEARPLLHALLDDELDAGRAQAVEAHVAGCASCAAELAQCRELRSAMRRPSLRMAAPEALRSRIEAAIPTSVARPAVSRTRRSLLHGFAVGTALSVVAATAVVVMVMRSGDDERLLGDAVSAHLRSLKAGRLTDVPSSDQQTVKPWFHGRVAAVPPVIDLAAQGYSLAGGRLDYLDGMAVAAVVYKRDAHVINLFVAAAANQDHTAARAETVQGLNTQRWNDRGFRFIAISDLSEDELREFHIKFENALRAGA